MRKRSCIGFSVLLVVAAGVTAYELFHKPHSEVMLRGERESYWIQRLVDHQNRIENVVKEWHGLGPEAIPVLVRAVDQQNGSQQIYFNLWPKLPDAWKNRYPRPLDPEYTRFRAATVLSDISVRADVTACPVLMRALNDREERVQSTAAAALGNIGRDHGDVLPYLVRAMQHTNYLVRGAIARSLGYFNLPPKAVPVLLKALSGQDAYVRAIAVGSLNRINPHVAARAGAVPILLECATHPQASALAAWALGEIGREPDLVVPVLIRMVGASNAVQRKLAIDALGKFGQEAREAMPDL